MAATHRTRVVRGTSDGSLWEMATRQVCPPLQPYVRRLVGYDERSPRPKIQRQFPEPFVVLIIEFGPPLRVTLGGGERSSAQHSGGFVAGLGDEYAVVEHAGHQRGIQVDLAPTGARRFFDAPLSEIAGRVVALRDLQPIDHATLAEELDELSDWNARLDRVETLLARRILSARVETAPVDWAIGRIEEARGNLKVGSLSRELGCSPRHLIALFHDQVGITPKLLARLVRFEGAMRRAQTDPSRCLAEIAAAHGYSDQAHLARDVKRFTGFTVTEARASLSELVELFG